MEKQISATSCPNNIIPSAAASFLIEELINSRDLNASIYIYIYIYISTHIYDCPNNDACNYKVIMCRIDPNGELHTHLYCEPVVLGHCQLVVSEGCCVLSENLNQHLDVSIFKSLLFKKK